MSERHYRAGTTKTYNARTQMTVQEIRDKFIEVGWLGKPRKRVEPMRRPWLDRGPGLAR